MQRCSTAEQIKNIIPNEILHFAIKLGKIFVFNYFFNIHWFIADKLERVVEKTLVNSSNKRKTDMRWVQKLHFIVPQIHLLIVIASYHMTNLSADVFNVNSLSLNFRACTESFKANICHLTLNSECDIFSV